MPSNRTRVLNQLATITDVFLINKIILIVVIFWQLLRIWQLVNLLKSVSRLTNVSAVCVYLIGLLLKDIELRNSLQLILYTSSQHPKLREPLNSCLVVFQVSSSVGLVGRVSLPTVPCPCVPALITGYCYEITHHNSMCLPPPQFREKKKAKHPTVGIYVQLDSSST